MEDEATVDVDEVLEEGGGACGEHAKRDAGDGAERGAKQRNGRLRKQINGRDLKVKAAVVAVRG